MCYRRLDLDRCTPPAPSVDLDTFIHSPPQLFLRSRTARGHLPRPLTHFHFGPGSVAVASTLLLYQEPCSCFVLSIGCVIVYCVCLRRACSSLTQPSSSSIIISSSFVRWVDRRPCLETRLSSLGRGLAWTFLLGFGPHDFLYLSLPLSISPCIHLSHSYACRVVRSFDLPVFFLFSVEVKSLYHHTHHIHPSIHPLTHLVHTLHIYISLRSRPRPYPYRTRKSVKSRLVYLLLLPPIRIVTPQPKFHQLYARLLRFSLYIIPPPGLEVLASLLLSCISPHSAKRTRRSLAFWRSLLSTVAHSLPLRLSLSLYSIDYRSRLQDTSSGAR